MTRKNHLSRAGTTTSATWPTGCVPGENKGDAFALRDDSEAAYAMLACARIGAIHSVVFGGFYPSPCKIESGSDCQPVITADEGVAAAKAIPLYRRN